MESELEEDGGLRILVKRDGAENMNPESGRFMKEEQVNLGNIHGWSVSGLTDVGFI